MPLSTKKHGVRAYRIGLSGKPGTGKSYAIGKMFKNPYIFDLERKLPPEMEGIGDLWDPKGRQNLNYFKQELLAVLNEPKLPYDGIVVDTLSKMEEMAETWAIEQDYKGDKNKYSAYSTGAKNELPQYFSEMLDLLTRIQEKHNVPVLALTHAKTKLFNNALGKDYYKWVLNLKEACEAKALQWFDYLGFIHDDIKIDEEGLRPKAENAKRLISFDNGTPLFDAKAIKPITPATFPFDKDGKWVENIFGKDTAK